MNVGALGFGLYVAASTVYAQSERDDLMQQVCSQVAADLNDGTERSKEIVFGHDNGLYESRLVALGWDKDKGMSDFFEVELDGKNEIFQTVNVGGTCPSLQKASKMQQKEHANRLLG